MSSNKPLDPSKDPTLRNILPLIVGEISSPEDFQEYSRRVIEGAATYIDGLFRRIANIIAVEKWSSSLNGVTVVARTEEGDLAMNGQYLGLFAHSKKKAADEIVVPKSEVRKELTEYFRNEFGEGVEEYEAIKILFNRLLADYPDSQRITVRGKIEVFDEKPNDLPL